MKLLHRSWWENTDTKQSPPFYIGGVRQNTYFHSREHYRICDQIGRVETFGEFRPDGTDSEALQGWLLKFREDRKKICTRVGNVFNWLVNQSPPWAAYRAFISVHLIALDNKLGMHAVSVGEPWRRLFVNCVLKVNGPESTNACQDDQLCARLKAVIDGAVHRVQYIWDAKLSTENWGFLLVDAQNAFN